MQKHIVMACCIIHFTRHNQDNDKYFNISLAPLPMDLDGDDVDPYLIVGDDETHRDEELCNSIANRLWVTHNQWSTFHSWGHIVKFKCILIIA